LEFLGKGNSYEARFGYRQSVIGDDAGIEARSSNIQYQWTNLDTSFDNENRQFA
jgi:hypothetical protein